MSSKLYKEEWVKFYKTHGRYFQPPAPDMDYQAYYKYFNATHGPLFLLGHPAFYKLEILDTLYDNLVCSRFVQDQRFGQRLSLLFQFNEEAHAEASLTWSTRDNKLIVSPFQFYVKNPDFAIDFFSRVSIYEHDEETERKVGFA